MNNAALNSTAINASPPALVWAFGQETLGNFTMPIQTLTGLGPEDLDPFLLDFSDNLIDGDFLASIVAVAVSPVGMTVAESTILPGQGGANTAVGFTATVGSPGTPGAVGISYVISISILTAYGYSRTRSITIPIVVR